MSRLTSLPIHVETWDKTEKRGYTMRKSIAAFYNEDFALDFAECLAKNAQNLVVTVYDYRSMGKQMLKKFNHS